VSTNSVLSDVGGGGLIWFCFPFGWTDGSSSSLLVLLMWVFIFYDRISPGFGFAIGSLGFRICPLLVHCLLLLVLVLILSLPVLSCRRK